MEPAAWDEAIREGDLEVVMRCVEENPRVVEICDNFGRTALHVAAKNNFMEVASYLLNQGADVNVVTFSNQTALYFVCCLGHLAMVEMLMSKGADTAITGVGR